METLIATAFGRYVNLQRGEGDQLTEAAGAVFRSNEEGSNQLAPDLLIATLCKHGLIHVFALATLCNSHHTCSYFPFSGATCIANHTRIRGSNCIQTDAEDSSCPHRG